MEEFILSESELITVPKGQILMKPKAKNNKYATSVLFIEKGIARVYSNRNEKVFTMRFLQENSFSFSIERNLLNKNDEYSWETIETCQIRIFDYKIFEKALNQFSDFEKLTRQLLLTTLFEYQELCYNSRVLSAEERFDKLMLEQPNLFLRVPLGHIATYLGITPQVLSTMRSRKNKK
jgi:hypothetical protein